LLRAGLPQFLTTTVLGEQLQREQVETVLRTVTKRGVRTKQVRLLSSLKKRVGDKERRARAKRDRLALTRASPLVALPGPAAPLLDSIQSLRHAARQSVLASVGRQTDVVILRQVLSPELVHAVCTVSQLMLARSARTPIFLYRAGAAQRAAFYTRELELIQAPESTALCEPAASLLRDTLAPFLMLVLDILWRELPSTHASADAIRQILLGKHLFASVAKVFTIQYDAKSVLRMHKDEEAKKLTLLLPASRHDAPGSPVFQTIVQGRVQDFAYDMGDIVIFRGVDVTHRTLPVPWSRTILNFFLS